MTTRRPDGLGSIASGPVPSHPGDSELHGLRQGEQNGGRSPDDAVAHGGAVRIESEPESAEVVVIEPGIGVCRPPSVAASSNGAAIFGGSPQLCGVLGQMERGTDLPADTQEQDDGTQVAQPCQG